MFSNVFTIVSSTFCFNVCVVIQVLEDVGFVNVIVEDRTDQFIHILQKELNRTMATKDDFVKVRQLKSKNKEVP